ncbi:glycosyltransferase family 4 protein [Pedobacter sp. ASV1-7]|uniref:MraY family glycosyltransferase n=1 Tax=Pedobacter sp. ASV1-7 TaxID=3145237 RepID=UPI0032E850D1
MMLLYFKLADHYNIIDKPNERSSHTEVTIRGGGIIFLISAIFCLILHSEFWLPILGMIIIGTISFIDDRITLSNKIRIFFHLTAVTLLFFALNIFQIYPWYFCIAIYILVIGIINAYNFMDGINGITGLYSLVVLGGLQYVNYQFTSFIEPDLIWLPVLACLVFLFFNFRKRAKCFAGDVGSISIAFWISYLIFKLIIQTENYAYILFLSVYGVDAILTIIHRLLLKQNIFKAHRLHFYQILANDQKWPHLWVATLYAALQCLIVLIIIYWPIDFGYLFILATLPLVLCYIFLKKKIMISV